MNETHFDIELNCRGLSCPLPIVKTKMAISKLREGQVLKIISTDPGTRADMTAWSSRTGHKIIMSENNNGEYIFYLKHK